MQKTKIGISVGLMGAIVYFCALFGGYIPALLIFGYIMIIEDNPWLRRTSVKSIILLLSFSLISTVVGFIPTAFEFIDRVLYVFGERLTVDFITKIHLVIESALGIIKPVLFVILGLKALSQGTLNIPVVDNVTNNNME